MPSKVKALILCKPPKMFEGVDAVAGRCRDLKGPADIGNALALVEELLSSAQLTDDLLGVVTLAFHRASPRPVWPAGKLSQGMVQFPGSTSPSLNDRLSQPDRLRAAVNRCS